MERSLEEALKVLGIPADSDRERVTNAYRRLARAIHPDVSSDPDAAERFATVAAAYRLVSAATGEARRPTPRSYEPGGLAGDGATPGSDPHPFCQAVGVPPYLRAGSAAWPPIVAGPVMVWRTRGDVESGDA